MTTRERILDAALTLFATKGYGDVYVGEIADAVGIKAPSLYKHFGGKQEIFDALIEDMTKRYAEQAQVIGIDGVDAGMDAPLYENMAQDSIIGIGRDLLRYFLHDPHETRFRRMLTLEQFKSPELGRLYTKQYFDDPIAYHTRLFGLLAEAGLFDAAEAEAMAFEFYTPIYTLLTVCDREPTFEPQAQRLLETHLQQFDKNYRKDAR